ncbi:Palmitoyltransferase PFA5 [Erysiphe neolycopersici]|uniref:Palmitoyltransferase n=1 Tax=Erysiphe neolycopersici TaxID=212602 RepID=A0A420HYE7_9PEZI|nr:Palmitoyltransferase PFA5 [Erysiphe neolycopersici]
MLKVRTRVAIATWTARLTPFLLVFMAGYTSYVVIGLLSVEYLLAKKNDIVTAASILISYCLIIMLLFASFLRLTYTTYCDPPYVPLGKFQSQEQGSTSIEGTYSDKENYISSGLESFHEKNVFISDYTGKPFWCSPCANWKPDRAHHCSQTGRCIRKMDHFCPWVGGPVGESNFKFFIQFTSYGALYCSYVLIVVSTIISSKQRKEGQDMETSFIITLGLASTFLLFSGGMSFHGIRLATSNMTQVERIGAKRRVYNLAAIVPPKENLTSKNNILQSLDHRSFITYPIVHNFEPMQSGMLNNKALEETQAHREAFNSSLQNFYATGTKNSELNNISERNSDSFEMSLKVNTSQYGPSNLDSEETLPKNSPRQRLYRTFVILRTNEGENPWNLGSRLLNWKTVMGNSIFDWFLPIHRSPCCNHDNQESQFEFGFAVDNHLSRLGLTKSGGIQDDE